MAQTIWKYTVDLRAMGASGQCEVTMPQGARLVAAADDRGDPAKVSVWALVNPEAPFVLRRVGIVGTGRPCPGGGYVATVVTAGGRLVWHVFDGGEV